MSIYDKVNALLEDKTLNVAQVAAIGKSSEFGTESLPLEEGRYVRRFAPFVTMDDGSKRPISWNDYEVLESNLEEMAYYWCSLQA